MGGSRAVVVSSHECVSATNPHMTWLNELEQAPGRNTPFQLEGAEQICWRRAMIKIAWGYLAWQACNASLKAHLDDEGNQSVRSREWLEKTSRAAPPGAEHWSALEFAVSCLLQALLPFRRTLPEERAHVSNGWWTRQGKPGEYQQIIEQLGAHANQQGQKAKGSQRGRPSIDPHYLETTRKLLTHYEKAFHRSPSASIKGPTVRFVGQFFNAFKGEWCYPSGNGGTMMSQFRHGEVFVVPPQNANRISDLIKKAIQHTDIDLPPSYPPAIEGLFPRPFSRPTTFPSTSGGMQPQG